MTRYVNVIATIATAALLVSASALPASATKIDRNNTSTSSSPPPVPTEATTSTSSGETLLEDDFSSEKWGTASDERKAITYKDDELNVVVLKTEYFVWSTPNQDTYSNVHMEITGANNKGSDAETAFGLLCDQQESNTNNFYYFAITPKGEYAIAKAIDGKDDLFLTNNNKWATSPDVPKNASSYRLGADCSNGQLTLYVNGTQIASVKDSTYSDGIVGAMVWSGSKAKKTDVSFDDFLLTQLQ